MPRPRLTHAGLALLLPLLAACASAFPDGPAAGPTSEIRPAARYAEQGLASWYGARYHGRQTASGERFDMRALTAAHRTLPFGTRVQVTNLSNGRSIVVRINDRGPFVAGRVIDLSRRGAERLGFIQQGLTEVTVQTVDPT